MRAALFFGLVIIAIAIGGREVVFDNSADSLAIMTIVFLAMDGYELGLKTFRK